MIKNVGFIGAGVMGKSMIRNLMKKGFQVTVYSRTKSKAEDIIAEGAIWRDSAAECAKGQDVIITIPARNWLLRFMMKPKQSANTH